MFYPLLHTIIENNLKKIIEKKLKISFYDFKYGILKKLGLVLSGSTMLLSICGNKWAHHKNILSTFNINSNNKINRNLIKELFYDREFTKIKNNINFNLYINTEKLIPINYKLSNILHSNFIYYDYTFPLDDKVFKFFTNIYIKYLKMYFDNEQNKNKQIITEYEEILQNYNVENKLDLIIKCFDFIYTNIKQLEDFHALYYNIFNNCSEPLFTNGQGNLILKLYKIDFKYNKINIFISMDLNWCKKINTFDFDFLKIYWYPNNEDVSLKTIFYNNSLFSIIHCNYNNYNKYYIHQSAYFINNLAIKCNVKYPLIFAIPTISLRKFQKIGILYMWQSLLRKIKYFFRGFYCFPFTINEVEFFKQMIRIVLLPVNYNDDDYFNLKYIQSNEFLNKCYNYYSITEKKEISNCFFWMNLKIQYNEHLNITYNIDLINDIIIESE
jgi:hypothetical protein